MPRKRRFPTPAAPESRSEYYTFLAKPLADQCKTAAPCGVLCILSTEHYHIYHTCANPDCEACHGRSRYQGRWK